MNLYRIELHDDENSQDFAWIVKGDTPAKARYSLYIDEYNHMMSFREFLGHIESCRKYRNSDSYSRVAA